MKIREEHNLFIQQVCWHYAYCVVTISQSTECYINRALFVGRKKITTLGHFTAFYKKKLGT